MCFPNFIALYFLLPKVKEEIVSYREFRPRDRPRREPGVTPQARCTERSGAVRQRPMSRRA
jgi:hypothetical protein